MNQAIINRLRYLKETGTNTEKWYDTQTNIVYSVEVLRNGDRDWSRAFKLYTMED